jgi:hypothetical protein
VIQDLEVLVGVPNFSEFEVIVPSPFGFGSEDFAFENEDSALSGSGGEDFARVVD